MNIDITCLKCSAIRFGQIVEIQQNQSAPIGIADVSLINHQHSLGHLKGNFSIFCDKSIVI